MRKSGSCTIIASKFGVQKQKSPLQDESFLGGFLAEPLTTEPLINRNPGSSKTIMNQQFAGENSQRVIFRVIEQKL